MNLGQKAQHHLLHNNAHQIILFKKISHNFSKT